MEQRIIDLVSRKKAGTLSEQESVELEAWVSASPENALWYNRWMQEFEGYMHSYQLGSQTKDRARERAKAMLQGQQTPLQSTSSRTRIYYIRVMAAASIFLLALAGGIWFLFFKSRPANVAIGTVAKLDAAPGKSRATLTLANGQVIILDSVAAGRLATQSGTEVVKDEQAVVSYQRPQNETAPAVWNTISTPSAGQYSVVLSDGTKVWLNATSSLHFPTAFTGANRQVTLIGEGYFEVVPGRKPFMVSTGLLNVEVLGTHFEVKNYADEDQTRAVLLEGAVRVRYGATAKVLTPGQEGKILSGGLQVQELPNPESEVAWVKGNFSFFQQDIRSIMRQISRWYDVDVVYDGTPSDQAFTGIIGRKSNISDVLKMLQDSKTATFSISLEPSGRKKVTVKTSNTPMSNQ